MPDALAQLDRLYRNRPEIEEHLGAGFRTQVEGIQAIAYSQYDARLAEARAEMAEARAETEALRAEAERISTTVSAWNELNNFLEGVVSAGGN